jgi:cytoskeletal protein CcmA (bactofilin family)
MKSTTKYVFTFLLLIALAAGLAAFRPAQTPIQGSTNDRFVLGGVYTLKSGETLDGNLFVLGGMATLEPDSHVAKDVMVMGGALTANGTIGGDVNAIGGLVTLGATAVVDGDVNIAAGNLTRDEGATVKGNVNSASTGPFQVVIPSRIDIPQLENIPGLVLPGNVPIPNMNWIDFNPLGGILWWLGRSFIWAVVALLLVLFIPLNAQRTGRAAVHQPLPSGGLGCLTILVAPIVIVALAITICGIPLAVIGAFLLWAAWLFGIVALGLEAGERMTQMVHQDWAPAVSAALGTFTLTLVINGIGAVVPCIGWLVPALVGLVGLGAAMLTRFGAHNYPPEAGYGTEPIPAPSLPAKPVAPVEVADASPVEPMPPTSFVDLPDVPPEMPAEGEGGGEPKVS